MKKYDLKRAVITQTDAGKMISNRDFFRKIDIYKAEIAKLPQPVDRKNNAEFLDYQRAIQKLRINVKTLRRQRLTFDVYVKQYKKSIEVEAEFQHCELGPEYRNNFKEMIKKVVDSAIRRIRKYNQPYSEKHPPGNTYWFSHYNASFIGDKKTKGRTFFNEGEVLRVYVEKNLNSLYEDKKPVEPRKYIGIELEFCAPIKENKFAVALFRSGIHKFAQLKKDLSLRPHEGETGYELAILLEESNYKKRLKQLTKLLTEVKAVAVDRRAGLHVHLDMRRRDKDLVYNNLVACQYALLSVVDPKRVDNEFCRIVNSRKFPTEFTGEREERYKTINAAAFYKYKTLEVRMHEGSVDYNQISNWVDLLIRIANYGKKIKDDVTKVTTLKKRVDLDKKLYDYMQGRSCHWQLNNQTGHMGIHERLRRLVDIEQRRDQIDQAIPPPQPEPRNAFQRAADEAMGELFPVPPINRLLGLDEVRAIIRPAPEFALTTTGTTATIADDRGYMVNFNALNDPYEIPDTEPDELDFDIADEEQ